MAFGRRIAALAEFLEHVRARIGLIAERIGGDIDQATHSIGCKGVSGDMQAIEIESAGFGVLQLLEMLDGVDDRTGSRGCLNFNRVVAALKIVSRSV